MLDLTDSNIKQASSDSIYRIAVSSYHKMIENGIFAPDDAVELLDGQIINKMPKDRLHVIVTYLIVQVLRSLIDPEVYHVETQEPITLRTSEPEPDAAVIRGSILDYSDHPKSKDVVLVVEVANSSYERDREWKKEIYASEGIPLYWLINLNDQQIECYSDPTGTHKTPTYRQLRTYIMGEQIPLELDRNLVGLIDVKTIFPKQEEN